MLARCGSGGAVQRASTWWGSERAACAALRGGVACRCAHTHLPSPIISRVHALTMLGAMMRLLVWYARVLTELQQLCRGTQACVVPVPLHQCRTAAGPDQTGGVGLDSSWVVACCSTHCKRRREREFAAHMKHRTLATRRGPPHKTSAARCTHSPVPWSAHASSCTTGVWCRRQRQAPQSTPSTCRTSPWAAGSLSESIIW